ncbi:hypothetical protein CDAR_69551 [Caerostris darwini]|uniref:C2H2-type domain-containing protein n=1 Tax=Caerostris darwini TaxID=1538125 RepID=A0AAV4U0R3_9ARAC|nr:hypothetical protein CDAR_69551 [Caerostris darwini]
MDSSWDVEDPVVNRNISTNNKKNCMLFQSSTSKNKIAHEEFNFTGLSIDDEPSNCKECDQTFKQTYCFLAHLSVHMPEGTLNTDAAGNPVSAEEIKNKSYVCPVCRKRFRKKDNLIMQCRVHAKHKPYVCNTCCKRYKGKQYLEAHYLSHSGISDYICDICNKSFMRK